MHGCVYNEQVTLIVLAVALRHPQDCTQLPSAGVGWLFFSTSAYLFLSTVSGVVVLETTEIFCLQLL